MKKSLVALFALLLIVAFAACSDTQTSKETAAESEAEAVTSIPLFEGMEYPLEGAAYADCEYTVIDAPEWMAYDNAISQTVYHAEGADIPYIVVTHWPADDGSLEETAEYAANKYSLNPFYETFEYNGYTFADIFTDSESYAQPADDVYYYVECMFTIVGDEEITLSFYHATEEAALGDSGKYLWIPVGYERFLSDEDMAAHNVYFSNEYDDSYYIPSIYASADHTGNYEEETWAWSIYPDGLPFDEAAYNSWFEGEWDEASGDAYYEALGMDDIYSEEMEVDGCTVVFHSGTITEADGTKCSIVDSYILVDDVYYNFCISTSLVPTPVYFNSMINSLHSK